MRCRCGHITRSPLAHLREHRPNATFADVWEPGWFTLLAARREPHLRSEEAAPPVLRGQQPLPF